MGGASSRAVAARFGVGESSVQRWERRFRVTGSVLPRPMGGSKSPLDGHREWLLARVAEKPDHDVEELRPGAARARRVGGLRRGVAVL